MPFRLSRRAVWGVLAFLGVTLAIAVGLGIVAELRMAITPVGGIECAHGEFARLKGEAAVWQGRVDALKAALPELEREAAELKAKGGCLQGAH